MDPRFDPAYQRGFAGGTESLTDDERAFARPDSAAPDSRRARRAAPSTPELRRAVAEDEVRFERARALPIATPPQPASLVQTPLLPAEVAAPPAAAIVSADAPPLRSNPWFFGLLGAGLLGTVVGFVALYWALATPLSAFAGSDTSTNAYVLHQMVFYLAVPLLGCLPTALLIALALFAARWRGRIPPPPLEEDDTASVTLS
ncbi:hypothetical protein HQQ80_09315 [Microbacteriaceae bacterium VKM Ac-2855]|nr:hypothetical protein [Microbacteriaceae bacterium VKM Ac-2855]